MTEPETTEPDTDTPTPQEAVAWLTDCARSIWDRAVSFFGTPMQLMARGFVSRRCYNTARDWILHLERLVLRVITLAAPALDLPAPIPARPAGSGRGPSASVRPMIAAHRPRLALYPGGGADRSSGLSPVRSASRREEHDKWAPVRARGLARRLAQIAASREDPDRPVIGFRPWRVISARMTSGQFEVSEAMIVSDTIGRTEIERWQAQLIAPS